MSTSITPPGGEGRIRVRDGRKLGFATFGPPDGRPILWLHGTPGARRQIPEDARLAAQLIGIRFIGVDRPGTGLSTSHLYDSVLDFAADLEIVLDELGVGELAVIGLSGGGPYALASAYAMPDRIKVVGVLGGVAPSRGPEAIAGGVVGVAMRFSSILPALRVPLGAVLSTLVLVLRPVGHAGLVAYSRVSPPGDRAVLQRPEIEAMFLDDLTDTGGRLRAPVDDAILFTRDWGFSLRDVKVPVKWWHGDADHIVPLEHGRHCVDLLPDAELFCARPRVISVDWEPPRKCSSRSWRLGIRPTDAAAPAAGASRTGGAGCAGRDDRSGPFEWGWWGRSAWGWGRPVPTLAGRLQAG